MVASVIPRSASKLHKLTKQVSSPIIMPVDSSSTSPGLKSYIKNDHSRVQITQIYDSNW